MTGVARIGAKLDLLELEADAFALRQRAIDTGSIEEMKRAVDVWRIYERELAETFKPGSGGENDA